MGFKVKAKDRGYYGYEIREPGAKFEISKPEDFSHVWMSPIGWTPPSKRRTAAVVDKAEEGEADPLSFKGAKEAYGEGDIEITLEEAINRAIDDADLGVEQWNGLADKERKSKIMAAVKQLIEEEKENRSDDDESEEDDEIDGDEDDTEE